MSEESLSIIILYDFLSCLLSIIFLQNANIIVHTALQFHDRITKSNNI